MLSTRLVEMIQKHADQLMEGLVCKLKSDPKTPSYHHLSSNEIFSRSDTILRNLGAWMEGNLHDKMQHHYKEFGAFFRQQSIPLHEMVYALILTKNHLLDYARTYGLAGSVLDIYAELGLQRQLGHFFDDAIYYAALGYEKMPASTAKAAAQSFGATPEELARL